MAVKINFDSVNHAIEPTFVLMTKSGIFLGVLPVSDVRFKDCMNAKSELGFMVYKENCKDDLWDNISDFKIVWAREWNDLFEIYVSSSESDSLAKTIQAYSLGESELSQINLYGIEINTEDDIAQEDYKPTVIYNSSDSGTSLLNRILGKAPHYQIGHVDASLAGMQRSFSFDKKDLYSCLEEIATEIDGLCKIECGLDAGKKIKRTIHLYDLNAYCLDCGNRGTFEDKCPKCGSENILPGYGEDTSIFVNSENLADEITFDTDEDSVKTCFKLEAGDDLMTATVINCNPNGSGYIWSIPNELREGMTEELSEKLSDYDNLYREYQTTHETEIDSELLAKYNSLAEKYRIYDENVKTMESPIVGYPAIMESYYNALEFYLLLQNTLMPGRTIPETTAEQESAKLTSSSLAGVAVQNLSSCSLATANNAVLGMAKVLVDSRYSVKVKSSEYNSGIWSGIFTVTSYSDETDTAESGTVTVILSENYESFVKQKIEKTLKKQSTDKADIVSILGIESESDFKEELKKYCSSSLTSLHDCCQSCIDILIEQGIADKDTWADKDPDLYATLYVPSYNKLNWIQEELSLRESEIAVVYGLYDKDDYLESDGMLSYLERMRNEIQNALNFRSYLGNELWAEFSAYRREDTYSNGNYISDGLSNAEMFRNAMEFISTARKDIYKSANLQHNITATLKNLLFMPEFRPIVDKFSVGNWIRIRVDGKVYRLRLLGYEIDFSNPNNLSVTFSDVKSVKDGVSDLASVQEQAQSMASSYESVSRQASKGQKSNEQLRNWVTKGLALTQIKIVEDADNQNVTYDKHGLLCREYVPITDDYDDKQLKIINKGLYLTDDNWRTSRAGIGNFTFYNPISGQFEESYGVIADTLIGSLVLSEKVGIYNKDKSISLGENGINITTDNTGESTNRMAFTIQKKTLDESGNEVLSPTMYIDSDGNMVLNGTIRINSSGDTTLNDLTDMTRYDIRIDGKIENERQSINAAINDAQEKSISYTNDVSAAFEQYKHDLGQWIQFGSEGLTLGAIDSAFKTVIDNQSVQFHKIIDGTDTVISYVQNTQLCIPHAVIDQTLTIGGFYYFPADDGSVAFAWKG